MAVALVIILLIHVVPTFDYRMQKAVASVLHPATTASRAQAMLSQGERKECIIKLLLLTRCSVLAEAPESGSMQQVPRNP
jgi:hypothetical protein